KRWPSDASSALTLPPFTTRARERAARLTWTDSAPQPTLLRNRSGGPAAWASMQALLSWQRIRITGHSMTPTLLPGDLVLVRHGARVRPGAVVLASFRSRPELLVIKRAVRAEAGGWLLASDNPRAGSDSRQ